MTKKRRMFDIELPEVEAPQAPVLETKSIGGTPRRGPMATAIGESAEANRRRAEAEADIHAENDALAHEFVRLKRLGLETDVVLLDAIRAGKLVRDRSQRLDPERDDLKSSILAIGLSNPILVKPAGQVGCELVQGWQRVSAFRALLVETGEDRFAAIPASLMPAGENMDGLYRHMVDAKPGPQGYLVVRNGAVGAGLFGRPGRVLRRSGPRRKPALRLGQPAKAQLHPALCLYADASGKASGIPRGYSAQSGSDARASHRNGARCGGCNSADFKGVQGEGAG